MHSRYIRYSNLQAAIALAMLTACSASQQETPATPQPVLFSSTVGSLADTRAGQTGPMTTDKLKDYDIYTGGGGFGVFAYYTANQTWASAAATTYPNFMYNQQVYWDDYSTQNWVYEPLKFWPNENQPADDQGATGAQWPHSYLSFFAYAPYVDHTASLGTSGIINFSSNETKGAPTVTYALSDTPAEQVDLLWGTRGTATYQEADGTPNTDAATVNTDLTKQTTTERVDFLFRHALASLDIYVQRVYDEFTPTGKKPDNDDHTKIFVSQLQLTIPAGQFYHSGKLDLATGTWTGVSNNASPYTLTITSDDIAPNLQGTPLSNDNLTAVQNVELNPFGTKTGADETLRRLTERTYATMLLPCDGNTGITLTPTLSYNFVTQDPSLQLNMPNADGSSRYARIQHTVEGDPLTIGTEYDDGGVKKYRLKAGYRYIIYCYIGVESVRFQVVGIEDWDFPLRYTTSLPGFNNGQIEKSVKE